MRKNYKIKKTISVKHFISEFGENFSEHMKERLLDLEVRCVLTRKEEENILDIKHVEHTKYDCPSGKGSKEYAYGEFTVIDGTLYFSEKCLENDDVMQSPITDVIYNSLSSTDMISDENNSLKKVDDSNIDSVIDSILSVCPDVSQRYLDIVKEMTSHSENKLLSTLYTKAYH
ncbi:hypothetical protein HBE96_14425 [Clostridium sp. P21]|uniref:Uncharacterized protein n=1 Tax=Clostridium muellerianum TaxID=2716538 RepID=A0A7Y0EK07_9CLOT|nr:hypothetical protein [Clostridium muellerianum]NMM63850.1 hypothetical protein [Clostridium muellerianum]